MTEHCLTRAEILFGCYRKSDANDPKIYLTAALAIMLEYPKNVIDYITDPVRGLPATKYFLPSIAEIREACEIRQHLEQTLAQPTRKSRSQPYQAPARLPGQFSYAEFLAWAATNSKPGRPIGRFEHNPTRHNTNQPAPIAKPPSFEHPITRQMTENEQQSLDRLLELKTENP
jgi:hypothetical protein